MHVPLLRSRVRLAVAVLSLLAWSAASADQVKVATKKDVGPYLTDAKGMALYVFKKDAAGKSACAGDCVAKWPIYYGEKVTPSGGAKDSDFATITREDGQKQTTFRGLPLYYFSGDRAPSETNGQGFKELWTVAKP
jgi:predicted lipoprotein with Yx(FWY)xxD motif